MLTFKHSNVNRSRVCQFTNKNLLLIMIEKFIPLISITSTNIVSSIIIWGVVLGTIDQKHLYWDQLHCFYPNSVSFIRRNRYCHNYTRYTMT